MATALSAEAGWSSPTTSARRHHPRHADADHQRPAVSAARPGTPASGRRAGRDRHRATTSCRFHSARAEVARRLDPLQADVARGPASRSPRPWSRRERSIPAGLPARAGRRDARLVHAPGRPLHGRLPRAAASATRCSRSAAQPELAVAVTLQPVDVIDVDAAILFSDLLLPFTPMGLDFDFVKGEGPSIANPIRSAADVDRLRRRSSRARRSGTCSRRSGCCARELDGRVPLIGFGGAPFTLAAYAIEGGPVDELRAHQGVHVRAARARGIGSASASPTTMADYLRAQVEAGAQALQMFDSWAGALGRADYREFALPHTQAHLRRLAGDRRAARSTSASARPRSCRDIAEAGGDVIGVDWRQPLDEAWETIGHDRAASRATSIPRCCSARASGCSRPPTMCCGAPADARATSSISATACCRTRRSSSVQALARHVHGHRSGPLINTDQHRQQATDKR